jgi:hypothetical protein
MTLFEQIVNAILTEDVEIGKVNDAIDRTYEVKINYLSDGDDSASGERIIQPVAYGLTKAGNPVIRAFQPYGDTKTKTPAWKFFRLDRIQSWKPMYKRVFKNRPPDGFEAEGIFNDNGDKSMSVVYNIAQFGRVASPKTPEQKQPSSTSGPVFKKDLEKPRHISVQDNPEVKKMEKLRKQLDNPRYFSDIVKDKSFGPEKQEPQVTNQQMTATSGPVTKDTFKTQTERDIESRREQMNKNERVSQDVLDQWKREQEKKRRNTNDDRTRFGGGAEQS